MEPDVPPRTAEEGPYRAAGKQPLYLCIVCFRSLVIEGGACAECGAPLLPLAEPDVVAELRDRARRISAQRRHRRIARYLGGGLLLAAAAVTATLIARPDLSPAVSQQSFQLLLLLGGVFGLVMTNLAWSWVRRRHPLSVADTLVVEDLTVVELLQTVGLEPSCMGSVPEQTAPLAVCVACFGGAGRGGGPCPNCGVEMRRLAEPDVLAAVRRRVKPPRPPTGMALIYWVIGIGTAATVFLGGAATFTRRGALQVASLALGFGLHALLVLLRMRRRARTPVDLDPVEALSPEALLEKLGLRVG